MADKETKKTLTGIWHSLHGVIWLIGLYILWTRDWWWPGILVLVAVSALYEGFLRSYVPGAYEEEIPEKTASPVKPVDTVPSAPLAANPVPPAPQGHRIELLPQVCPSCNGPIRGHEVKWTGPQSANCPYCGTNLPMNKA